MAAVVIDLPVVGLTWLVYPGDPGGPGGPGGPGILTADENTPEINVTDIQPHA